MAAWLIRINSKVASLVVSIALGPLSCDRRDKSQGLAASAEATPETQVLRIDVTPAKAAASRGDSVQFKATALYPDQTTRDITDQVIWKSTDYDAIAMTNGPGGGIAQLILGPGTARIEAVLGGVTGSADLTITIEEAKLALALIHDAQDGYINVYEKGKNRELIAPVETGRDHHVMGYAAIPEDAGSCPEASDTRIPTPRSLAAGTYRLCAKLAAPRGVVRYALSSPLTIDLTLPTVSLVLAPEAADGIIDLAEKTANVPLLSSVIPGSDAVIVGMAVIAPYELTCMESKDPEIPRSGPLTEGSFKVCATIKDAAGNYAHFGSDSFTVRLAPETTP